MSFKPKSSYLVIDAIDLTVAIAIPSLRSLRPSDGERRNLKKPNRQARDFSVRSLHSLSRNDNGGVRRRVRALQEGRREMGRLGCRIKI